MKINKFGLFVVSTMACQSNEWTPTFGGGGSQQPTAAHRIKMKILK